MRFIVIAALCAAAPAYAQTSWQLATGYRAESFHTQNLVQFASEVSEATQGKLAISVVPGGALFKLNDISGAVQTGKVQAGETIMTSLVTDMPLAGADSIPFVVSTYANARKLWQLQRPGIEREFAQRGLKVLYAVPWPPQGLYATKPIKNAADFNQLHMRTYNQTTVRIAQLLGATPVEVPMAEVGKALSAGKLDTMITSAITGVENKVWGQLKYYYEINAWFPKNIVFVNQQQFAALPASSQIALLKSADAAQTRGWAASADQAASATQELQSHGIRVERMPPDLDADIRRLGERFSREWVRSVGHTAGHLFVDYYLQ